jgi:SET family sugar efflux transporter-like MFS transporter
MLLPVRLAVVSMHPFRSGMPLVSIRRTHVQIPRLLAAVLLVGAAEAITGPYIVLFGSDRAHLSPFQIGTFISLTSLSGIAASTWLGRRYDAHPSRLPLLLAITAAAMGYLALTWITSFVALLGVGLVLLGCAAAAFPQIFVLAHSYLDAEGFAESPRYTALLRSAWSIAWAIGPLLGAFVLARLGYSALFLVTAALFALVALPVSRMGSPPRQPQVPVTEQGGTMRPLLPLLASTALFNFAMFSGSVVLPLYVTRTLGFSNSDVGVIYSVCAMVEVGAAFALMAVAGRVRTMTVVQAGTLLLGLHFVLLLLSDDWSLILLSQVARGIGITAIGAAGIAYVQRAAPGMTGRATTMLSNAGTTGQLAAGVIAGATMQLIGDRGALLLFGVVCVVAWLLVAIPSSLSRADAGPTYAEGDASADHA